jgi:purine-binding chemotaxis protein CheW
MDLRQLRDDPAIWRVLEERSQALAHRETAKQTQQGEEILSFQLGDGRYGISASFVREVQVLRSHTPLPGTPPFVLGLVNLRGRLLSVLDIRPLLSLPLGPPRAGAVLLIIGASGMEVALLADEVIEIRRGHVDLAPSLAAAAGQAAEWVQGVDRDLGVRIDVALMLADARLIVNTGDGGAAV